jgi:hypothetical protein
MPAARTRLSWNEFQQTHKGRGWSKQEMSEQWKVYKASQVTSSTAFSASFMHGWLQLGRQRQEQQRSQGSKDAGNLQGAFTVLHTLVKQSTMECLQQHPPALDASPAASTGSISISPITPSSCWSSLTHALDNSSNSSPGIPAVELTALRTAVEHLLGGQQGLQQHLHNVLLQDSSCQVDTGTQHHSMLQTHERQQQQQQQHVIHNSASMGCFGFNSSSLSWNGFQRACKGLGMSKAQLSAAWKHYKATGQLPSQLQQQLDTQPAADCTPSGQQPRPLQAQQHHHQQQQEHPAGSHKWATLKDWVQRTSRASSRAVSRAMSRVVSPAASPQPSPGAKARPKRQQQQLHATDIQDEAAAAAMADAVNSSCSMGGFVAAEAVAAAPAGHWLELDSAGCHAYQRQVRLEQQLQENQQDLSNQQQHRQPGQQPASGQQQKQRQRPSAAVLSASHASSHSSSRPSGSAISNASRSSTNSKPPVSSVQMSRTAREVVDHSCPGLLDGFGPWMPVSLQPCLLKHLKTAIPAKPGLYEWGVRLPAGTTAADLAGEGAEAGGGATAVRAIPVPGSSSSSSRTITTSSGVRIRSGAGGLAQGQPGTEYGPVICFYLGKAGELQLQPPVNLYCRCNWTAAAAQRLCCLNL